MNIHALSRHVVFSQHILPQSTSAEVNAAAALDMSDFDGVMFILNVGVIAATGTIDADVEVDDNSGMTSPTNLTGGAITQLTDTDDNKIVGIDIHGRFGATNRFIRLEVTAAVAASVLGVIAIQYRLGGSHPADVTNFDELLEIVIADVDVDPGTP